ncbi:MAG: AgmX/PglI C-terminal domain-containing protein [Pseudomonadota bacterium]
MAGPSPPREPSLKETGRIAAMPISGPGARIQKAALQLRVRETKVRGPVEEQLGEGRPAATGTLDQATFDQESRSRLLLLPDCRIEVARRRGVTPTKVKAGRLVLRWIVLPNGSVSDAAILQSEPTDRQVMECVKRRMVGWSFTPPTGGAATVERELRFDRPRR